SASRARPSSRRGEEHMARTHRARPALAAGLVGALAVSTLAAAVAAPAAADVGGPTDDGLVAWYPLDAASTTGTTTANLAEGSSFGPATLVGGTVAAGGKTLGGTDDYGAPRSGEHTS